MTQTIEQLQAEIAALKEERAKETEANEVLKLQQELADLKAEGQPKYAPGCPQDGLGSNEETTKSSYSDHEDKRLAIESARVRTWAYALGAYVTGPIWTGVVAARTKEWTPFWIGLGVGVVSLPFAVVDLGFVSSIPATAAATVAQINKTKKAQKKLGIQMAEQADAMRFSNF